MTTTTSLTINTARARISRIEPTIRSVTVSPGDRVTLSVDIYGAQDIKANALGDGIGFLWSDDNAGGNFEGNDSEVSYTAPDRSGTYTVSVATPFSACRAPLTDEVRCAATFEMKVRRSSAAVEPTPAPSNPAGAIPSILTDPDGNQYEVFTPEGGGTFTGETSSLKAGPGAVPNGEVVGLRISEGGSASNEGKTYQRYTLGGNWYEISAVDASNDQRFVIRTKRCRRSVRTAPERAAFEHLRLGNSRDQRGRFTHDPVEPGADIGCYRRPGLRKPQLSSRDGCRGYHRIARAVADGSYGCRRCVWSS